MRRLAAGLVVGSSGFVAIHELGRRWGATRESSEHRWQGRHRCPRERSDDPRDHDPRGRRRLDLWVVRPTSVFTERLTEPAAVAHRQAELPGSRGKGQPRSVVGTVTAVAAWAGRRQAKPMALTRRCTVELPSRSPVQASRPSRVASAIPIAASGSAHHHPTVAFRTNPAGRIADRWSRAASRSSRRPACGCPSRDRRATSRCPGPASRRAKPLLVTCLIDRAGRLRRRCSARRPPGTRRTAACSTDQSRRAGGARRARWRPIRRSRTSSRP